MDGPNPVQARAILNQFADEPLLRASQLTLNFYLFFKKRDPILNVLMLHANEVFSEELPSDLLTDISLTQGSVLSSTAGEIDEEVDVEAEREKAVRSR